MALPSDYISLTGLYNYSSLYIDVGIAPTSDMSFELSVGCGTLSTVGYVFGSRKTNSNTSAEQMNFYIGADSSASYFGWASARVNKTITMRDLNSNRFHISSQKNDCVLVNENQYVYEFIGSTTSFTGSQNIHLFGMNNGGTHLANEGGDYLTIYGFRLYDGNTLIRDMMPVYKVSTGKFGMYDLANDTFYGSASGQDFPQNLSHLLETDETEGGEAFVKADGIGYVKKQYFNYKDPGSKHYQTPVTVYAIAKEGYTFDHWEIGGVYESNENEYTFQPTTDTTIKAIFLKEVAEQENPYTAMVFKYGVGTGSVYNTYKSASFVTILRGEIFEDLLQRSTTTFECLDIPDSVEINTPIFVYNPKGKIIYYGMIKSIEDKRLVCREPIAIYDDDMFMPVSIYKSNFSTLWGVYQYMTITDYGIGFIVDKHKDFRQEAPAKIMPIDTNKVPTKFMPSMSANVVVNGEDQLLNSYSELGVLMTYSFYKFSNTKAFLSITPTLNKYDKIVIGDDIEAIKNVSVTVQEADATVLEIWDSNGTHFRGEALMRTDGNIEIFEYGSSYSGVNLNQFVGQHLCKQKVVYTEDNLKTVALANLNGAMYSHKITFTLEKNDLLRFDDLHLGQPVDFYYKNKVYNSVITAWSYSFEKNTSIQSMNITLGNARTSLTAIMNLKGKKKK